MKDFIFYTTYTTQYPTNEHMCSYRINMFKIMDVFVGTKKQIKEKEAELRQQVENYRNELRNKRNEEESSLCDLFKCDIFEHFGVKTNPKAEKCFSLAWEYGHSSGYSNVYSYFSDIVDLIID